MDISLMVEVDSIVAKGKVVTLSLTLSASARLSAVVSPSVLGTLVQAGRSRAGLPRVKVSTTLPGKSLAVRNTQVNSPAPPQLSATSCHGVCCL